METTIEVDKHKHVGPLTNMYGHGPVTIVQDPKVHDRDTDEGNTLFVCLDCGYTTAADHKLRDVDCDRGANGINLTWRERDNGDYHPLFPDP